MIDPILPQTLGEWFAWLVAFTTLIVGLVLMILPRLLMPVMGLGLAEGRPNGLSELRGPIGGVYVGFGLAVMLFHPQPLLYFALGAAFVFAVIGRLISMAVDRAVDSRILALTGVEALGAFLPLAYVFGWIA